MTFSLKNTRLAIVGLGYVGLPLAVEFGKKMATIGYDINSARVKELKQGHDSTLEVSDEEMREATELSYTDQLNDVAKCNVYIVTVPTPVDKNKRPDFSPLVSASTALGKILKKNDIVIYESTVYPGATEEVCVPVLEKVSGLKFNVDFYAGYSPERINPGDKEHRVSTIKKVTSGSTPEVADYVDALYRTVIVAGTHKASSLKVAEASKVIENTQRDLNIALVNELALIFNKIGIDTLEVLEAAGTKWNFLPFRPGLVGGHCISVDPYYLTHKAEEVGYHPAVILSGRRVNDQMAQHIASTVIKKMIKNRLAVVDSNVLVLGLTFKENCPDLRNTGAIDIVYAFKEYNAKVDIYDPWVHKAEAQHEYGVTPIDKPKTGHYDAIILAVAHKEFVDMGADAIRALGRPGCVLYDVKSILPKDKVDDRL
ncbi:MAG: Vi polysaccharide biosynthesis UDP-N-acetylglucosamine C-6 dehydrogenase TviB [Gammaproteobacteria bacterium]|nr:Vi polysaccharide biosynthesis UDP-N-acetylglucosamine C-6 dehydrogenase TviB [Gammaproteobacteria bacterium]